MGLKETDTRRLYSRTREDIYMYEKRRTSFTVVKRDSSIDRPCFRDTRPSPRSTRNNEKRQMEDEGTSKSEMRSSVSSVFIDRVKGEKTCN